MIDSTRPVFDDALVLVLYIQHTEYVSCRQHGSAAVYIIGMVTGGWLHAVYNTNGK